MLSDNGSTSSGEVTMPEGSDIGMLAGGSAEAGWLGLFTTQVVASSTHRTVLGGGAKYWYLLSPGFFSILKSY